MRIVDYIRDRVFRIRSERARCLVIYDPTRRYRDLVLDMATDACRVLDAGKSVIEQREAASIGLEELSSGKLQQLIVWIPAAQPLTDDERQVDAFGVFGLLGDEFPAGDGDDYQALCRRAKPDHIPEIERLFSSGTPSFETVDALDAEGAWPRLKTLLNASSSREILLALLTPKPAQADALSADATWELEAREFVDRLLGHKLITRGRTLASIADELWRLVLFSEFAFDSADELPPTLATVPRAWAEAESLVFEVCHDLRSHKDRRLTYMARARDIENSLALCERAREVTHLGERDTFPFEERRFLDRFIEMVLAGSFADANAILEGRTGSIWRTEDDGCAADWTLAECALDLLNLCDSLGTPNFATLAEIVHAYAARWRELDRMLRELEQAVEDDTSDHEGLAALLASARDTYLQLASTLQTQFVGLVTKEGWPLADGTVWSNTQIFTRAVEPALADGQRVAYVLVDSLRYELAVELEKQLAESHVVDLRPVCAQLPTYTEIGMASLMPEAETALRLVRQDDKLVTSLGGDVCTTPAARLKYLRSRKGDLCSEIHLDDLIKKKKFKIPEKTRLLLVRTTDIDKIGHSSPHQFLKLVPRLLRQILRGVSLLESAGFQKVVIVTDHGFVLLHEQAAGDVAPKPPGEWLLAKARCVVGTGSANSANVVLKCDHIGIPGEGFSHFAAPRALVPYARGELYYHEGLSLQECILPCISITFRTRRAVASLPKVQISYRQGKTNRVTSRRPVLDLSWPELNVFGEEEYEVEVAFDILGADGEPAGTVGIGQGVNPATLGVRIRPGQAMPVGLRMADDFSGAFTVRVLDPTTNAQLDELKLRTDYLE